MSKFKKYWDELAVSGKSRFDQVGMPDANEVVITSIVDEMLYYIPELSLTAPILEVGCGNGLLLENLHRRGYSNLIGFDYSSEMISKAKSYCSGIDFRNLDTSNLKNEFPKGSFDLIYVHSVAQYFDGEDYFNNFLEACLYLLSATGTLYIGDLFNCYVRDYLCGNSSKGKLSKFKRLLKSWKYTPTVTNFYLDLTKFDVEGFLERGYKVYPLLELVNKKSLMFKALRYNMLIKRY